MLRRMVMRRVGFWLVPLLLLVAACSGSVEESDEDSSSTGRSLTPQDLGAPAPSPDAIFVINYDPSGYDSEAAGSALNACSQLPGTEIGDQADSLPPTQTVVFTGSAAERGAVEECLRRVPAATVTRR